MPSFTAPFTIGDLAGALVALALTALVRWLLPAKSKRLARQPAAFLVLHLLGRAVLLGVAPGSTAARIVGVGSIVFLLASIGRSGVLLVLEGILSARLARPLPRIFGDIVQGIVYVAILLLGLRSAGVEPGSILTTSALLTAAVALSLQETLGNLVAGLAIQAQRPFDLDDWIQFDADPKHIGRVIEINWRATKIVTLDEVEVIVPNATLAKAPIINFTKPAEWSRRSLFVQVPAEVPPHLVQRTILDALASAPGLLAEPAPSVVTNAFIDGNVEYWIRFFTDRFHQRDAIDGGARDRVWYAFARSGIAIAAPGRAVALREVSSESLSRDDQRRLEERITALASVDFLNELDDDQRRRLAAASSIRLYGTSETVFRQGDASDEMFIVQEGEVAVVRERASGDDIVLARLGPGQFFGEMALMTGERRAATVRATRACVLIGVSPKAIRSVLESSPGLAEHISRVIAERQAAVDVAQETKDAGTETVEERSSQLLGRIRKFFAI